MYFRGQRVAARRSSRRPAELHSYAAPVAGWVTYDNLAAQRPNSATLMDNWFPTERSVRLRGGAVRVASIGSDDIRALFAFTGSAASQNAFFAASESAIYKLNPFDLDSALTPQLSGLSGGDWQSVQQTTSGGEHLVCVNGADAAQLYDGASWSTAPITFSGPYAGLTSAALSFVWKHKGRLFFTERGGTRAFYLPVDSIGGNIGSDPGSGAIELGAIFQRGGYLMFGGTWSLDAGDGMDDRCVFVSSLGEVAIYAGTDPSDSAQWSVQGRYDISEPLGPQAVMQAGGDLLIATHEGLIPVSQAINRDVAALALAAVSRPIEPNWRAQARASLPTLPWQLVKWPRENMAILSLPHSADPQQFVVNLQTGAWSRYRGWPAERIAIFEGIAYYSSGADVFQMEAGGSDNGANILHQLRFAWDHVRTIGRHKQAQLARATFLSAAAFNPRISVGVDYRDVFPAPPTAMSNAAATSALWGTGVWGDSLWGVVTDAVAKRSVTTRWQSVAAAGFVLAPELQVYSGGTRKPDAELIQFDMTYEAGAAVV